MNSNPELETEAQAIATATEAPGDAAAALPPSRAGGSGGSWWLVFGVLLLLGVGGGLVAGYRYWLNLQADLQRLNAVIDQAAREQAALQSRVEDAQRAFAEQEQRLRDQQDAFESQQESLEQERQKLRLQEQAVEKALETARQVGVAADSDWMLAEAAYLMRLAQERLALAQDSAGARAALDSADQRLLATGNPRWVEVREVLASEKSALAAIPEPDLAGVGAALDELIAEVGGLPLGGVGATRAAPMAIEPEASDRGGRSLGSLPGDLWNGFSSLMAVRRYDEAAPGPGHLSRELYQHESLRLQLEAARAALAQRNSDLYQGSLDAARRWLDEFAAPDAELSIAFRQRLAALAAVEIAPELPDISASLHMLERRRAEDRGGAAR